jgi:hypothetical protein
VKCAPLDEGIDLDLLVITGLVYDLTAAIRVLLRCQFTRTPDSYNHSRDKVVFLVIK